MKKFTKAEPRVDPEQGWGGEKTPLSPPLHSWCIIGQAPASRQGPTHGAPPGRGRLGKRAWAVARGDQQSRLPGGASEERQRAPRERETEL